MGVLGKILTHRRQQSKNINDHLVTKTTQGKIGQSLVLIDTEKTKASASICSVAILRVLGLIITHKGQQSKKVNKHLVLKTTQEKNGQSLVLADTEKTNFIYGNLAR